MKTTTTINYFLMGIWMLIGLLGFIDNGFWMIGAMYAFLLGLFQGITGLILFLHKPFSTRFQLYAGGLLLFSGSCFLPWEYSWMLLPIPLALYFTFMLRTINPEKL